MLISQNGKAYVEGISKAWEPWQRYWREPTPEHREGCRDALSPQVIRDVQYRHGANPELISPDGYTLDIAYVARLGADEAQLDLILDYRSNVALEIPGIFPQISAADAGGVGARTIHFSFR